MSKYAFLPPTVPYIFKPPKRKQARRWLPKNKKLFKRAAHLPAHTDMSHMYTPGIKRINICCQALSECFTVCSAGFVCLCMFSHSTFTPVFTLVSRLGGSLILCQQICGANGSSRTQTGITSAWATTPEVNWARSNSCKVNANLTNII